MDGYNVQFHILKKIINIQIYHLNLYMYIIGTMYSDSHTTKHLFC